MQKSRAPNALRFSRIDRKPRLTECLTDPLVTGFQMPTADLIIENASILTMDPENPRAEALAVQGNRIIAVGNATSIEPLAGHTTKRIDAQGCTVLPGLVEAHMHLFWGGYGLKLLQLTGVKGLDQLAPRLRAYADANPTEGLLICKAADYNLFGDGKHTTRQDLDAALSDRPVILLSSDHHTAWANTIALEKAGILYGAKMPVGCEVVMADDGTASGELREQFAYAPVLALRTSGGREDLGFAGLEPSTPPTAEEREEDLDTLRKGLEYCASFGFTSLHNMDGNFYQLELLRELERRGELICRTEVPFHLTPEKPVSSISDALEMRERYFTDRLRSGRIKMFMDGVIDSGTAFMFEPFTDGSTCEALHTAERFNEICIETDKHGLQISVHSIGDAAVRRTLEGYEAARKTNGPRDSRHRVEHIEVMHPDDLHRFAELGVIASVQPSHPPLAMDFPRDPWAAMVGEALLKHAFPDKALREANVPIAFSSDWPITDINPMRSVKAAMTRPKLSDDCPDNTCTLHEALHAYTAGGAYAGFDEDRLGMLKAGMLADLVIMDSNLEKLPIDVLDQAKARTTIVDGQIVWGV